ncbi:MAG: AAA family ATPase [Prevotellaceae bacterium]|nr:AAA family ATPase [Prevotellaceae bacterium]
MILTYFNYKEPGWELAELAPLKTVNLIVGRNATGKSRTIRALLQVAAFMQMKDHFLSSKSFTVDMAFSDPDDTDWNMSYGFKVNEGIVEKETLSVKGGLLLKRTRKTARYKEDKINPPSEKLVVQIRRDKELYPEIERLMQWVEGVTYISFSDINPFMVLFPTRLFSPMNFSEIVDSLTDEERKSVLNEARMLGYNISEMTTIVNSDIKLVQIKERSVPNRMLDMQLSSGMLRTLYLLCFMQVIKHNRKLSMLLVDDMGEGLDYGRSTQFGKMIFENCESSGLQLVASSNDAFLMDVVDIDNWQVLSRKGGKVTTVNRANNSDMFRKFRMTGLSNFDFFSSDFIDKFISRQQRANG